MTKLYLTLAAFGLVLLCNTPSVKAEESINSVSEPAAHVAEEAADAAAAADSEETMNCVKEAMEKAAHEGNKELTSEQAKTDCMAKMATDTMEPEVVAPDAPAMPEKTHGDAM